MIDRHYRKPHRYKRRKPILRKKFVFFSFLVITAIAAVFYGLFFWQIFWVETIAVSGEQEIAKSDIESLVQKNLENEVIFFNTKSIFKVDTARIRADILSVFPRIASAEVKKSFFDAIDVKITERMAVALWCENNSCFLLDSEGIIFETASADSGLIVIESADSSGGLPLGKTVLNQAKLAQILKIKSELALTPPNISIDKAVVSDERLDAETSEGWQIRFNLKGDLDWQISELKLVLEKQISPQKRKNLEYIDLRFSRVYYK